MSSQRDSEPPIPDVLALLACNRIDRDATAKTVSLSGLSVYAKLNGAVGRYRMRCELVRLDDGTPIAGAEVDIEARDGTGLYDLFFATPNPLFVERSGKYEFRLFANDHLIRRAPFGVRLK